MTIAAIGATTPGNRHVLARLEARLLGAPCLEGILLDLELAAVHDDLALSAATRGHAAALGVELAHQQQRDGSWNGDVFATCDVLRTLRDLHAAAAQREAYDRAVRWLIERTGAPGRFGEHCDAERHAAGLCHHVMPPFCSVGHAGVELRGARLPDGTVFGSDDEARLCGAALAVREQLAAGITTASVRLQSEALAQIAIRGEAHTVASLGAPAYAAIADALRRGGDASPPRAALRAVAMRQRGEGSWPHGENFILDVLSRACAEGVEDACAPLRRAASHLAAVYGSRTLDVEPARRLLVAWRTLHCAG